MPARKPPARRQGRGTADLGVLTAGAVVRPQLAGPGRPLLRTTQQAWATFWRSGMAGLVEDADLPALVRLFRMYDARERAERVWAAEPFAHGSTHQLVAHPAAKVIASLDGRIDRLEPRFGITPKGRLELGVTFGAAARSLEELNRDFAADDQEEEDPRGVVVELG